MVSSETFERNIREDLKSGRIVTILQIKELKRLRKNEYLRGWARKMDRYSSEEEREKHRLGTLKWLSNPVNRMHSYIMSARRRSKKKNIPFNISVEDFLPLPQMCPVFNIPLNYEGQRGKKGWVGPCVDSPSLDKIIPDLGYVKGNVRV